MGTAGKIFAALNEVKANPDVYAKGEFQKFTEKVIHLQKESSYWNQILIHLQYNKVYATQKEYDARFEIFKGTLAFINTHNADPTKTRMNLFLYVII